MRNLHPHFTYPHSTLARASGVGRWPSSPAFQGPRTHTQLSSFLFPSSEKRLTSELFDSSLLNICFPVQENSNVQPQEEHDCIVLTGLSFDCLAWVFIIRWISLHLNQLSPAARGGQKTEQTRPQKELPGADCPVLSRCLSAGWRIHLFIPYTLNSFPTFIHIYSFPAHLIIM